MTQLSEAVHRYHKILESRAAAHSGWLSELREEMAARGLVVNARPVSPVLRPHFLSRRQYSNLVGTSESLYQAIDRLRLLVLSQPALLARMELLPAEKMLAQLDPGYSTPAVAALLNARVNNGTLRMPGSVTDLPLGVVYGELLAELFYDAAPVREFRKRYKLVRTGGAKPLIAAVLKVWKEFGGRHSPSIAILEFRQPFSTVESQESLLLAELLATQGHMAFIAHPDQLEYRDGVLRSGGRAIDLIWRNIRAQEFLLHFDLDHPLVSAYRDKAVCMVNSFRAELTRKRSLLALLTDEQITQSFPAAERKAIRDTIPWTRVVAQAKTTYRDTIVDLPHFILENRERLTLGPVDGSIDAEAPTFDGALTAPQAWDRALRTALRHGYVVQERLDSRPESFPVDQDGELVYRDLDVEVCPHAFLGKIQGCSSKVAAAGGFSTLSGFAPTFILEQK